MRHVAPLLLAALLGCLPDAMIARPRYFAPLDPAPAGAPVAPAADAPLLRLRRVHAAANLRERMVWRRSDTEFGFHELSRWTQSPAAWVDQRLARELFERRGLRRALAGAHPLLQVNLLAFDEVLEPEHVARVELSARLSAASGAALLERTYAAQQPLEGRGPEDVARAIGAALAEVLGQLGADAAGVLTPS